ncbi:hypothetical protein DMENIID0001_121570 [Sergentomyia squamirostris]
MNGKRFSGRTSSQISIYDYPEHLNPFYEDENHKRLRFWKIGRKSDKIGRSSSFSIDGLKDFWTLKSFRLKKKSSNLGINKTSESPPPLRKTLLVEEHDADRAYHTLDPSSRHTVSVGLNNSFQRSARYRSSLQDMNSYQQSSAFSRCDKYRNTMQNGQDFIHRGGSKTPQLHARSSANNMVHSSSQQSLDSTNPFDEDGVASASSAVKKPVRKKRRAPPPPIPPKPVILQTTPKDQSVQEANSEPEQAAAISNLTAEIESFVKSSEIVEDSSDCREISIPVPVPRREKKEAAQSRFEVRKSDIESDIVLKITESIDDLSKEDQKVEDSVQEKITQIESLKTETEIKLVKEDSVEKEETKKVEKKETTPPQATSPELRSPERSDPYKNVVVEMEKYEIRFAPLKTNDEENHRRNPVERQRSVQEIIDSINKSQSLLKINYEDDSRVQTIMQDIESQKREVHRRKSSDSLNRNIRELEIKEQEMQQLIKELEVQAEIPLVVQEFNNNTSSSDKCVQLRDSDQQNANRPEMKSSIEWNPLPKPRRSRNFSEDASL